MQPVARKLLCSIVCFCVLLIPASAQKKTPDRAIAHLYEIAEGQTEKDFEREHVSLDGDAVKYIPFRKDKLYGFVDKTTKKWVLQPRFSQVYAVYPEGAIVQGWNAARGYAEEYGLTGYTGKWIIPPVFENLYREGNLYHGLMQTLDTAMAEMYRSAISNYYFDSAGRLVYVSRAHRFQSFAEGDSLAWGRFGTRFTVFNRRGRELKQFDYESDRYFLGIFNNTLVFGTQTGGDGPVRYTGYDVADHLLWDVTIEGRFNAVYRMSDNAFAFISEDGFFLTDERGREMPYGLQNDWYGNGFRNIFPVLNRMSLIPVRDFKTGLTGYINKEGRLIIPCRYKYAGVFQDGLAPYLDTARGAIGFMDSLERKVVPPVVPMANLRDMSLMGEEPHFSEGLCRMELEITRTDGRGRTVHMTDEDGRPPKRVVFIDRSGAEKLILPDSIILAGSFSDGLAPVVGRSRGLGFIDKRGKLVVPMKYELAVAGAYPFPQVVVPYFRNGFAYLKAFKGYVGRDGYPYFSGVQVKDRYNFSH